MTTETPYTRTDLLEMLAQLDEACPHYLPRLLRQTVALMDRVGALREALGQLSEFASNECTCDTAWKGRKLVDPACCYHEFEHEITTVRAALTPPAAPDGTEGR